MKKRDVATFTDYYRWYYTKGIRQLFKAPKCKTGKIFIEEVINWALRKNIFVNFSTVILPKWWFKVLKFQDFMKRSEDLPFLLDSIIAGYKWHHIPEPLLDYRIHRGQVTRNRSRQQFNLLWGEISTRLKILGVDEPKIREAIKESEEKYFESLLSRAIHKMIKLLS